MATTKATTLAHNAEIIDDLGEQSVPHIIPGVLYPAVAGKLLDGSTSHGTGTYDGSAVSTNYGTTQSDGRKYYYTDIKGSKPIKDPRIGGHFGSQRCTMRSWQLLEQETAMEGYDVYSVDGREWMRINDMGQGVAYGNNPDGGDGVLWEFNGSGAYLEVTGYFSAVNMLWFPHNSGDDFNWKLDGASAGSVSSGVSISSPLGNRYVNCGSVYNLPFSSPLTTPGIHTIKLVATSGDFILQGFELIAQDTTSTANRSKIQIPSQNVVSYGKKFNISGTPHYDPFNGFTSGNLAAVQALGIDTDTSLGLNKWLPSDAGTTYYRPFNGGRVVKWVDSSGTIKTSVNMMPPNAKSIANSASPTNAFATRTTASHFGTNNAMNSFEAGTDLDSDQLSEVAKTFYFREFGNGNANGGNSGTYKDASMLNPGSSPGQDIAYVMDDGITSLAGSDVHIGTNGDLVCYGDDDFWHVTFIGTGLTFTATQWGAGTHHIVQNLPYGTHIMKVLRHSGTSAPRIHIDGVDVNFTEGTFGTVEEITFHQPKKPPIPEDACVLADYMLMADFVKQVTEGTINISKGVRVSNCSRDVFYDQSAGTSLINALDINIPQGWIVYQNGMSGTVKAELPYFGTDFVVQAYDASARAVPTEYINSTSLGTITYTGSGYTEFATTQNTPVLGLNGIRASGTTDAGCSRFDIATPIHTSSHYQTFETPFLHELIGGDRNMEQHNLVVSPDGKTWDEVTRDTSYIGKALVSARITSDQGQSWAYDVWDDFRGERSAGDHLYNKDFAIAYDRWICLKEGFYNIYMHHETADSAAPGGIIFYVNTSVIQKTEDYPGGSGWRSPLEINVNAYLKRGDYLRAQVYNVEGGDLDRNIFHITRL